MQYQDIPYQDIPYQDMKFPEDIAYGSIGGPEFSTDVITMQNGKEQRNINWQHARVKYNVAPGVKTNEQLKELISFFRSCQGKAHSFRFKDWLDYKVSDQFIGTYKQGQNKLQLYKLYIAGNSSYKRLITKPVKGTVTLFLNNEMLESQYYEVNYNNGEITINQNLEYGEIKASFEFDIMVRFDTDFLPISLDNFASYELQNIPIIEVK